MISNGISISISRYVADASSPTGDLIGVLTTTFYEKKPSSGPSQFSLDVNFKHEQTGEYYEVNISDTDLRQMTGTGLPESVPRRLDTKVIFTRFGNKCNAVFPSGRRDEASLCFWLEKTTENKCKFKQELDALKYCNESLSAQLFAQVSLVTTKDVTIADLEEKLLDTTAQNGLSSMEHEATLADLYMNLDDAKTQNAKLAEICQDLKNTHPWYSDDRSRTRSRSRSRSRRHSRKKERSRRNKHSRKEKRSSRY